MDPLVMLAFHPKNSFFSIFFFKTHEFVCLNFLNIKIKTLSLLPRWTPNKQSAFQSGRPSGASST